MDVLETLGTLGISYLENNNYSTPLRFSPVLPLILLSLSQQKNAPDVKHTVDDEYDYIVVGGGSAGSTVASRLSEIPCVRVLLLEAGKPPPILNDLPAIARNFWFSDLDWAEKTERQEHCGFGLENQQVIWPSGRGLGGSSLLNGMIYVRGNHHDFDKWEALGAKGWGSKDVLPYFKKLEDNRDYGPDEYHGVGGPMSMQKVDYQPEMKPLLLQTAADEGYQIVDSNGAQQTGYFDHQTNQRYGQRCSAAKAYLVPAEKRKNLHIVPHAFVKKIVIKNGRAVAVEFDLGKDGDPKVPKTVKASKEVIMSAGTVNTAKLLMLSGVGPADHLQEMGIDVIENLKVGDNLQDHIAVPIPFQVNQKVKNIFIKGYTARHFLNYLHNRTGPIESTQGISLITFLNWPDPPQGDNPLFENYFLEIIPEYLKKQFGMNDTVYKGAFGPYENSTEFVCAAQVLQPYSRGTIRLRSNKPYDPPKIDPNYYSDDRDLDNNVKGIKACIKLSTSKPMQEIGATQLESTYPGCDDKKDDEYLRCVAQSVVFTTSHPVGTARMGDPSDNNAVVDPELKVKNVEGLRVVDASVMPTITSGNTNIPTIMIAEKAADIIKKTIPRCNKRSRVLKSPRDPTSRYYYLKEKKILGIGQYTLLREAAGALLKVLDLPGAEMTLDFITQELLGKWAQGSSVKGPNAK